MLHLSTDLLIYITKFLSYVEVRALTQTCRALHKIYSSKRFWKNKLHEEHPDHYNCLSKVEEIRDGCHLTYKYFSLLPTFATSNKNRFDLLASFDDGAILYWLKEVRNIMFLCPVPISTCQRQATADYYYLAPDIFIEEIQDAMIVLFNKRESVLGPLPKVGQDLPHYDPSKRIKKRIEYICSSFANIGKYEVMVIERSHLMTLLAQIKETGYCFANYAVDQIKISQRDVDFNRDLFQVLS